MVNKIHNRSYENVIPLFDEMKNHRADYVEGIAVPQMMAVILSIKPDAEKAPQPVEAEVPKPAPIASVFEQPKQTESADVIDLDQARILRENRKEIEQAILEQQLLNEPEAA